MSELCFLAASLIAQGQASAWQVAMGAKLSACLPKATNASFSQRPQVNPESISAKALVSIAETDRPRPEFSRTSVVLPPITQNHRTGPMPTGFHPTGYREVSGISTQSASAVRPFTGGQLFQQRLAALKAGKTYTRLPTDSFHSEWINAREQPTYEQWSDLLQQEATAMVKGQGNARLSVLVGDSLSLWFPSELMSSDRFWLNQGISGDTTTGVLQRLSTFDQTRPDTIYVMAGINDLRQGATDAEVLNNLRLIMRRLKQKHPQSKIIVHSILPTRLAALPTDRIRRLNAAIATATQEEGVFFLNLQPSFMDESGILRRDLTTDGIHLSSQGYRTWESVIATIL